MNDTQLTEPTSNIPIACLLDDGVERETYLHTVAQLFHEAVSLEEHPDGYEFRFVDTHAIVERLTAFIVTEHRCCPFLTFGLQVGPPGAMTTLSLTGNAEVKAFIGATFVGLCDGREGMNNTMYPQEVRPQR